MSNIKYVLNSTYWLNLQLRKVADKPDGFNKIKNAYHYLILHTIDFDQNDLNQRRKLYKRYIYFDSINEIFGGVRGVRHDLVARIYHSLQDILGSDYQFNHQMAKCLMYNASYVQGDRKDAYRKALDAANKARDQVNNEMQFSNNEKLAISLAHIEYTVASIKAYLCKLHEFTDLDFLCETIVDCYAAINNPYNEEDFERDLKRKF